MRNKEIASQHKILLVSYEYGRRITGGIGRVVNGLFGSMPKDVVLDVFVFKYPYSQVFDLAYVYRKDNHNKARCIYSGKYQEVFRTALEREKYDLVNLTVGGDVICWCVSELRKNYPQIKRVFSCHSIAKHELKIRNNRPTDLEQENYILTNSDHIHVLNKTSLNYLKNSYDFVKNDRVTVIPNGIEESDYQVVDPVFREKLLNKINKGQDMVICCISRWSFGKGLEYLSDAMFEIVKKHKNVKLVLAGRKPESWEYQVEEYVQMIDEKLKSIREYVIPLGWLDNKKRNAVFSIADICVMPSLLEYFPYSILEPMVCQVPVVSSGIDCVTEFIGTNKECMLYEPGNANELAEKLMFLIENPQKRQELSCNAYQKVKHTYNWEAISAQYLKMYQTLSN